MNIGGNVCPLVYLAVVNRLAGAAAWGEEMSSVSLLLNKMIGSTNHIIPYKSGFAIFLHHIFGAAIGTSALRGTTR